MNCPNCPSVMNGVIARMDSLPIPPWTGSFETPGWQGNASAGIAGLVYSDTSIIDTTFLYVDEIDPLQDTVINRIVSKGYKVIDQSVYQFILLSDPLYYFLTQDSSKTFKVTVTSITKTCGTIGNVSYFKIAPVPGKPAFIHNEQVRNFGLKIYPNPTSDLVVFEWLNEDKVRNEIVIQIYDMHGRLLTTEAVNNTTFGVSKFNLSIAELPTGLYMYRVVINNNIHTGKLEKI